MVAGNWSNIIKEKEGRKFINHTFRGGAVKTTCSYIDKMLLPVYRLGGGNHAEKNRPSLRNCSYSLRCFLVWRKRGVI